MIRVFLYSAVLSFLFSNYCWALENSFNAPIEVISAGKKYQSFQDYKNAGHGQIQKDKAVVHFHGLEELGMENIQSILTGIQKRSFMPLVYFCGMPYLKEKASSFNKDDEAGTQLSKESEKLPDPLYVAISRVGFNTGVMRVIEDFQKDKTQGLSYKSLKPKDLEIMLRDSFAGDDYDGPILLISDKKKLRIMTLESDNDIP